jgi:WD40 repeat protein
MTSIFLSYARSDDEAFVHRLHADLTRAGFDVWFDRVSMPARQLTFHQEIRDAIAACQRLLLVVGPAVLVSDYVKQEWRFAYFEAGKCVNPIVRLDGRRPDGSKLDGYELIPEDLKLLHAEDFRDDALYAQHLANLIRQLSEPIAPVGKLVAVPELPPGFLEQSNRIKALRDMLLIDLQKPVVVSGAAARVGLQGMGGIGKSVLASALAHRPEVRRAFPDGIFWITLGQEPNLAELQRWLARELGDPALFADEHSGKECLRTLLDGRKVLLVLDDVWQREHAEAFNVVGAMGRILLTTRDAGLVTALASQETHYRVELPTEAEAEAIFAAAAQLKPGELPAATHEIVAQCGRLPLALALCGGMVEGGVSPQDVLEALREHDLEFLSTDHPAEEQHRNAWKAMDVSLRVLPPEQRERFAELAVFPLDRGAPEAAVATLWEHTGGLIPRHARKLLADFAARSLVQLSAPADGDKQGERRMTLHDLLHNFAEGMAGKLFGSRAALHQRLLDAYAKKCPEGWPSGPNDGYFFENLCEHLLVAGKTDDAVKLLTNFRWMEAKCRAKAVFSLQDDYRNTIAFLPDTPEDLRLIDGALQLSIHVVARDPAQLASQMLGRLLSGHLPHVQELTRSAAAYRVTPWLKPKTASLIAPGGPLVRVLAGHSDRVSAVAVTPDAKCAVSGSCDQTLKVWDLESGKELQTLAGHSDSVAAVAVTPDGKRAVSASRDQTLKVWELESGKELQTLAGHSGGVNGVAVTPDGKRAVSASRDQTLKVWDLESGKELRTLASHSGEVNAVAVTPDGKGAVSAFHDGTLKVWDLESGQELLTLATDSWYVVTAVVVTPDRKRAVSASREGTLKVWNLEGGKELRTLAGHSDRVIAVAVTPDGKRTVSASDDKTLKVWDLESGKELQTLAGHSDEVYGVAVTLDGKRAVSASWDKTLKVWDLESGKELQSLAGHSEGVTAVAVTPDGRRAVSTSYDKTLKVWDLENGKELQALAGHSGRVEAVALTPDGKCAVSASWDQTLKVWDLVSGKELQTLAGHSGGVTAVAVTGDGKRAVSASWDATLKVWDLGSGKELQTLAGHGGAVWGVVVTPDGKRVVSASKDTTLKVWDLESGKELQTLSGHRDRVLGVAVMPDGKRAVSASWDLTLKVWDLETGKELQTLAGHSEPVMAVAVTPDGKRAVSASRDQTLKVWDLESGTELRTLVGHRGWVEAVAVTPDGKRAVSASVDWDLKVWDLETGKVVATFTADATLFTCAVGPDGRAIVAGDESGLVHFLSLEE